MQPNQVVSNFISLLLLRFINVYFIIKTNELGHCKKETHNRTGCFRIIKFINGERETQLDNVQWTHLISCLIELTDLTSDTLIAFFWCNRFSIIKIYMKVWYFWFRHFCWYNQNASRFHWILVHFQVSLWRSIRRKLERTPRSNLWIKIFRLD